jgi:hypothetical protein
MVTIATMLSVAIKHGCHGYKVHYEHVITHLMIKKHIMYYVEIKCQLDATDEFFIADLIACSTCFGHLYAHHQEL